VLAVTNTEWLPNDMMRNSQIVDMDFVAGETLIAWRPRRQPATW